VNVDPRCCLWMVQGLLRVVLPGRDARLDLDFSSLSLSLRVSASAHASLPGHTCASRGESQQLPAEARGSLSSLS
jgi:hypothetical protein